MFGDSLDLADVLKKLKRADEALTEFVAPLWPGVKLVAAWMEKGPHLFHLASEPEREGYYLLGTEGKTATIVREADQNEAQRYRNYLERANVILLGNGLAYPISFAERLLGISNPRPILFADGQPMEEVVARFDGLNLLYERTPSADKSSPLSGLFSGTSIFTPGELLGVPGQDTAESGAEKEIQNIQDHPYLVDEYRLRAVLDSASATLEEWHHEGGRLQVTWKKDEETHSATLRTEASPIASGICLPGARAFDRNALASLLIDHALDTWR